MLLKSSKEHKKWWIKKWIKKKEKKEKKTKNKKRKTKREKNKNAPHSFSFIKVLESSEDKSMIFSNHVQSDNENFTCFLESPICHLHMSTFLNVCVSYFSFQHLFFKAFLTSLGKSNRSLLVLQYLKYNVLLGLFLPTKIHISFPLSYMSRIGWE
jgi:hypothetical protein